MTKVSRSSAISALLRGEEVWTGVCPEDAIGVKMLRTGFSRRQAAIRLTHFTYEDKQLPRHAHINYWLI